MSQSCRTWKITFQYLVKSEKKCPFYYKTCSNIQGKLSMAKPGVHNDIATVVFVFFNDLHSEQKLEFSRKNSRYLFQYFFH